MATVRMHVILAPDIGDRIVLGLGAGAQGAYMEGTPGQGNRYICGACEHVLAEGVEMEGDKVAYRCSRCDAINTLPPD